MRKGEELGLFHLIKKKGGASTSNDASFLERKTPNRLLQKGLVPCLDAQKKGRFLECSGDPKECI